MSECHQLESVAFDLPGSLASDASASGGGIWALGRLPAGGGRTGTRPPSWCRLDTFLHVPARRAPTVQSTPTEPRHRGTAARSQAGPRRQVTPSSALTAGRQALPPEEVPRRLSQGRVRAQRRQARRKTQRRTRKLCSGSSRGRRRSAGTARLATGKGHTASGVWVQGCGTSEETPARGGPRS